MRCGEECLRCLGRRADYSTRCDCSLLPGALASTGLAGVVVQTAPQSNAAHSSSGYQHETFFLYLFILYILCIASLMVSGLHLFNTSNQLNLWISVTTNTIQKSFFFSSPTRLENSIRPVPLPLASFVTQTLKLTPQARIAWTNLFRRELDESMLFATAPSFSLQSRSLAP